MKILRARLLERKQEEQRSEIAATRKLMVGSGDRSERIRTYNFPQGRLTDHRINFTLYKLERVMEGELDEVFDALITHYQSEVLRATGSAEHNGKPDNRAD
jgi:peptide chain release factor 1